MKNYTPSLARLTAVLAATALNLHAANLWWDPVPGTPGPGDGNGNWSNLGTLANWWDGAANVAWNPGDTAVFGVNSNIAVTVTITNKVVAGGIIFSNAGSAGYTIAGAVNTSVAGAAATNLLLTGASPTITLAAHNDSTNAQTVDVLSVSVVATGAVNVVSTTATTNAIVRFGNITNNFTGGALSVGTPGNATYGGPTAVWVDLNTPTGTDPYASIAINLTNVTVYSNASFRISNHNSGTRSTILWPKQITISGDGRNGNLGAWLVTGNVGDNFIANVTLAGSSTIDFNSGTAGRTFGMYGVVSGAGRLQLVCGNASKHTAEFTNASTYVGDTIIAGGLTVQLISGNDRLPTGTILTLGASTTPTVEWNKLGKLTLGNATLAVNQTLAGLQTAGVAGCVVAGGNSTNNSILTINAAADYVYAGTLGGAAAPANRLTLAKNGVGKLSLQGTNQCAGGYTVTAGTLEFGDGSTDYPLSGPVANDAAVVLNVGSSLTYADAISGTGSLTKRGPGATTLTATNTYAGTTTIEAGKLSLSTTKTGTGAINVWPSANLEVKRTTATAKITAASSTLDGARLDFNFNNKGLNATAPLQVTGALVNSGATTIYIAAPGGLAIGSYPLIKYGSYTSNDFSSISLGTAISPRVSASIQDNPANKSIDLVITAVDFLKWTGLTDGKWDTSTTNWLLSSSGLDTTYALGDFARFDDTASGPTLLNIVSDPTPGLMLVTNQAKDYTFGGSAIGGSGGILKQGSGKLTLANGDNSFSGGTTLQNGTLQVGDGTTDATLPLPVQNDAALVFNVVGFKNAGGISGSGTVSKTGAGELTLDTDSTYTGVTAIQQGRLDVAASAALGTTDSGTVLTSGAELHVAAGGLTIPEALTLSGSGASGAGALIVDAGASIWSGPVTATGDTMLSAATSSSLNLSAGINAAGRHLLFDAFNSGYFVAGPVTASSVTLTNTGGLHLSAANPGLTNIQNLSPVTYGAGPPITSGLWAKHDLALGTNSNVTITNGNHIGDTGTQLGLDSNVNIPAGVSLHAYCPGDGLEGPGGYRCSLSVRTSTTNTWNGPITIHGPDPALNITSLFILNGGNSGTSGRLIVNGDISIVDGPVNLMPRGWSSGQFNGHLNLGTNFFEEVDGARWTVASTGNTWAEARVSSSATLALGAHDALCVTAPVRVHGSLELNGFNQRVSGLYGTNTGVVVNHSTNSASTLTIQATNNWTFDGALVLSGIAGAKHFGVDLAGGGLTLTRNGNSYGGPTKIRSSATLTLTDTGDITVTTPIDVQAGGTFDVTAKAGEIYAPFTPAGHFRLTGNRILMGNGTVNGSIVLADTSKLSPGGSIGTLTVSGDVTNTGTATTWMEVNNSVGTNDRLDVGGTLTYGGTLVITNVSATAYTNNQIIKLFNAATYDSGFSSIVFPGVTSYDAANLTVDGTIKVLSVIPTSPTNLTFSVSGGNLELAWPASHTGWTLQAQTNSPGVGLTTNWVTVPGSTAVNSMSFPIDHVNGSVFFRLTYP